MRGNDDGSDVSNTDRGDGKTGDGAEELASDEDSGIETNTFVESVNLSEASSLWSTNEIMQLLKIFIGYLYPSKVTTLFIQPDPCNLLITFCS